MPALRFVCTTDNKASHEEIRRRTYMAGGAIVREMVKRDTSTVFEAEYEIVSEGGTLYREVKELGFCTSINIITQ